ncbi:MAG TPA: tryptophan--tRNA ligase [Candidatus Paceibacterota bacterium]|nr:tryptophan--tRNA ligase [Candidatus Paceibacterota bacterium]
MKPILVSGIQTTGRLHLGNYLGALKNFVDLQNSGAYECYFFLADLHSLTEQFDPKEKPKQVLELAADFLAAGLDPKKSVIFQQSQIPAHSELAWILGTIAPMGELKRMTQFKEKSERDKEDANVGLFYYPILMAADILLYDAKFVPVGDDQLQHLELARTLARKFNAKFGDTFTEPKPLLTQTPRVMNLAEPGRKMSKSRSHPMNVVYVDDAPEDIKAKIARATTDSGSEVSYEPEKKPGLANLIDMYAALSGKEPKAVAEDFSGKKYSEFKAALAELVADHFAGFRERKKALLAKPETIEKAIAEGSKKAGKVANKKMADAKKKIGLAL